MAPKAGHLLTKDINSEAEVEVPVEHCLAKIDADLQGIHLNPTALSLAMTPSGNSIQLHSIVSVAMPSLTLQNVKLLLMLSSQDIGKPIKPCLPAQPSTPSWRRFRRMMAVMMAVVMLNHRG